MGKISLKKRFKKKLRKVFMSLEKKLKRSLVNDQHDEQVKARLKRIGGGYPGSRQEFQKTVCSYWRKYGIQPKKFWFDFFCSGSNSYDPRYIPDPIWFNDIIPYYNDLDRKEAYADKGMFHRLLVDVKKPETIIKNLAGYYYNGDGEELIRKEEAVELCLKEDHLIFKPFRGSGGKGIDFYDRDHMNRDELSAMIDRYGAGFVAQRIVKQHPEMARLNPSSLNTVRVLSFHFQGQIYILSAQLRIGGENARVDNVCAGGSACAIYPDGSLHEKSVTRRSTWTDQTANGIKLSSIRIPHYEQIIESVKRLHLELPYFNIGWDFAVGEDGEPIMIEYNMLPGQNQIGGREPTFGDLTDQVLEDVFIKKTLKRAFK